MEKEVVAEDTPKFLEILKGISQISNELIPIVTNLSKQVDNGDICVKNGVSLLDVKNNTMLIYLVDLVTVLLSKVNGVSIADSEPVNRLVEYRTVLEKIRPLEQKLKYQINKVIDSATNAAAMAENDPLRFKPNINNFGDSSDGEESDEDINDVDSDKKYIPPHIAAVAHEEEDKRQAKLEKAKQKALTKSSIIAELIADSSDMPTEYSEKTQHFKGRVAKAQVERRRYEEENFTRLLLSKKQKALEKRNMRKSELDTITSFGSINILHGGELETPGKKRKKKSLKHGKSKKRK